KVWRNDGDEAWVVVHLEAQNQRERAFPRRMYVYNYRLSDRHDKPIVSLAILGDEDANWRPNSYQVELWGCRTSFQFPTVKLLDYKQRWEELENSQNPFATAVMAHLKAKETRTEISNRRRWKLTLTRRLFERGYSRQQIVDLYRFIDWVLTLPPDIERAFQTDLKAIQQRNDMPYISTLERMAAQQGRQELILNQLSVSVGTISEETRNRIGELDETQLGTLSLALLSFKSADDLEAWLRSLPSPD
ncbi:MAG: DUF4351 domain-containing protein, partial [Cyanobacteria bacterium J06648_11]